jgi:hypothetical protein
VKITNPNRIAMDTKDAKEWPVEIGNVYKVHGGKGGFRYQMVVGLVQNAAVILMFDMAGKITNSSRYGIWALSRKCPDGKCTNLEGLELKITWN